MLPRAKAAAHPTPSGLFVLAGFELKRLKPAIVDGNLAFGADPDDALLRQNFAKPGYRILPSGPWLLQLPQELSDRSVIFRRFEDEIGEVLRDEKIVSQRFLDRFGDFVALRLEVFHVELRLIRIGEVPALNHGEAVESLFQDVP